jgi:dienelactone hydrolase
VIAPAERRALAAGAAILAALTAIAGWRLAYGVPTPAKVADLADGRAGRVTFASHSATWADLKSGRYRESRVDVPGDLLLPDEVPGGGRVPAVILLHGSDGVTRHQYATARSLVALGLAVFVVDSFTARGVDNTIGDQGAVTPYSMLVDAYQALALLRTHPRIDGRRVALVGWSKGGMVADWASRERYRAQLAPPGVAFAAHAAFYPWCGEQHVPVHLTGAPLLYLVGARDDWTGAAPCIDYVERVRTAGFTVRLALYPDAEHGFDFPGRFRRYLPAATSWAACNYIWGESHFRVVASGEQLPWSEFERYIARCATPGAHVGSNTVARRDAARVLAAFLASALGLRGDGKAHAPRCGRSVATAPAEQLDDPAEKRSAAPDRPQAVPHGRGVGVVLAQRALPDRENFGVQRARPVGASLIAQRGGQIRLRSERVGMLVAERAAPAGEHLFLKPARGVEIALAEQRRGEVVHGREQVRMVGPEQAAPRGEHLFQQGACPRQVVLRPERCGEIVHRGERVRMCLPERDAPLRENAHEHRACPFGIAGCAQRLGEVVHRGERIGVRIAERPAARVERLALERPRAGERALRVEGHREFIDRRERLRMIGTAGLAARREGAFVQSPGAAEVAPRARQRAKFARRGESIRMGFPQRAPPRGEGALEQRLCAGDIALQLQGGRQTRQRRERLRVVLATQQAGHGQCLLLERAPIGKFSAVDKRERLVQHGRRGARRGGEKAQTAPECMAIHRIR